MRSRMTRGSSSTACVRPARPCCARAPTTRRSLSLSWRLGRRARVAQINHLGTGNDHRGAAARRPFRPTRSRRVGERRPVAGRSVRGWRHRAARWVARRRLAWSSLSTATCRNLEAAGFAAARRAVHTERRRHGAIPPGTPGRSAGRLRGWPRRAGRRHRRRASSPRRGSTSCFARGAASRKRAGRAPRRSSGTVRCVAECEAGTRPRPRRPSRSMGSRPDVPQILRAHTSTSRPRRTEGMSNSLLEGLASGCRWSRPGSAAPTTRRGAA
jgi:hypothetical protein